MTTERIEEICFGLGITAQTGPEGKTPHPPGTRSLRFVIERNGCRVGTVYTRPDDPSPRDTIHKILDASLSNYGVIEIWEGYPSEHSPENRIC